MNEVLRNLNFISIIASQTKKMISIVMKPIKLRNLSPLVVIIISCTLLSSCINSGTRVLDEAPTRGTIAITVDESFQPLLDSEVFTFTHLYTNAYVTPQYKPEYDVINDYMNDSVKVIVTSKKLTDNQIQYLRESQIVARTTTFAYDALALVINKSNPDTLINYNTIKDIFTGKITRWNEVNPKSKLGDIQVIFDNTKSGNIRYFKELFEIQDNLKDNFFAVNTNPEVIDFVSRNPNSIGIVSVNWISDKDDPLSMSFVKKIKVLAISQPYFNNGTYYRPYQGSIYDKSYPFVREIYLISRETFAGLGSGFINWACAEQGQRIVLKSGLVPATMPIRLVQIKH
ncbi:MAG TPA: substrate-binding domain-containing protein [Bacteroidales bacterium]|nr:substrate-binding domain-containing protein [Bacteroidales bacterium]